MRDHTDADAHAYVFGTASKPFRRGSFYKAWNVARMANGLPSVRLHDMRHAGNVLAASAGASTKELMARLGQDSPQAAIAYQHASRQRGAEIASNMSALIEADTDDGKVLLLRRAGGTGRP